MSLNLEDSFDPRTLHKAPVTSSEPLVLRLARNEDGEKVRDLVVSAEFYIPKSVPWDDIFPNWLVVEHEGEIVGCIQVAMSKPTGYLEYLSVKRGLPHRIKALAVRDLVVGGAGTLRLGGASLVGGMIPFELKEYKKLLKKHGCFICSSGNFLLKDLTE